jgi:hypothetical protein
VFTTVNGVNGYTPVSFNTFLRFFAFYAKKWAPLKTQWVGGMEEWVAKNNM